MKSKDELQRILKNSQNFLTKEEIAGMRSALARGLPYYGRLRSHYRVHFQAFSNMHKRCSEFTLDCDFERSAAGFVEFLLYLGDVPPNMRVPTLGRSDHDIGYVIGNFQWQEQSENAQESVLRNQPVNLKLMSGENNKGALLTSDRVRKMREFRNRKLACGWSKARIIRFISSRTDVSMPIVKRVILNLSYRDVD